MASTDFGMASTDLTKEHVESLVVPLHRDPLQKDATRVVVKVHSNLAL
jgi:hypothetical protein